MKIQSPYTVIFEDGKIIAVNKISGVSVGGDRWDDSKERLDKLLEKNLTKEKIFVVHRIDKETSGLVLFAKDKETHRDLSLAFERRKIGKKYIAIANGHPLWKETTCNLPLVPNGNKKHMTIIDKYRGKKSITKFNVLITCHNYCALEVLPETGRIHQIRVHAASLGHPVVCDSLYGNANAVKLSSFKRGYRGDPYEERPLLSRLGLHAMELALPSGQILTAPMPKDMASLIKQMEKNS